MKLLGNYLSPYVRRVAVSLNMLCLPFELEEVRVFDAPQRVRRHNPLTRIPTFILDDGEVLVESAAILDAIDEMVAPDRRLVPPAGPARRRVLKTVSVAVGAMEKAQWAFYEGRFRPAEKVHAPWVAHNDAQALAGLGFLDAQARAAGAGGWLGGTPAPGQADVSAAVAYTFARAVRPALGVEGRLPDLAAFAARCEALEAFAGAPLP